MRKFIYSLFLTVLLGIPLSANATIVDDPGVFNFAPFYDPSSGVIGLSLTFFPSDQYKYVSLLIQHIYCLQQIMI